jgi:heme oxygenase
MLGGRALAGGLDRVLGAGTQAGRRFFLGRGAATGAAWQGFLRQLDEAEPAQAACVASAVDMFSRFEIWMEGWRAT